MSSCTQCESWNWRTNGRITICPSCDEATKDNTKDEYLRDLRNE